MSEQINIISYPLRIIRPGSITCRESSWITFRPFSITKPCRLWGSKKSDKALKDKGLVRWEFQEELDRLTRISRPRIVGLPSEPLTDLFWWGSTGPKRNDMMMEVICLKVSDHDEPRAGPNHEIWAQAVDTSMKRNEEIAGDTTVPY